MSEQSTLREFFVRTACGRNFYWSAFDEQSLHYDLKFYGYSAVFMQPYTEYQAEVERQEQELILQAELKAAIEEDAA